MNRQSKALDLVKDMSVEQHSPFSFIVKGFSKSAYRVYTHGPEMLMADGREYGGLVNVWITKPVAGN